MKFKILEEGKENVNDWVNERDSAALPHLDVWEVCAI